jgi:hypothetical protein
MWSKAIAYYLSFAAIGAAIGFGSWFLQFHEFKAIKVVAVDRIDIPGLPTEYVTEPTVLIETIKSQAFAKRTRSRISLARDRLWRSAEIVGAQFREPADRH